MKLRILASASEDLVDAYTFYEKQRDGLGAYFVRSLVADIDALSSNAGIHPILFEGFHRALAKRFPFAIYYRLEDDTAIVYAVLDCRRSPAWHRKKLD